LKRIKDKRIQDKQISMLAGVKGRFTFKPRTVHIHTQPGRTTKESLKMGGRNLPVAKQANGVEYTHNRQKR
jgi:hypothetical protein